MSAPHRPMSEWVAEVVLDQDGNGSWDPWAEPNQGDRNSDARGEPRFDDGWRRRRILLESSGARVGALGLSRDGAAPGAGAEAVVELTDAGVPVPVSEAALTVVERLEEAWPDVSLQPDDLRVLASESPALRWSLLDRLCQEGDPEAGLFHALPWELVERLAGDLRGALDAGGGVSGVLLAHWFAPTGSVFSDAMDEMNLWLRDHGTDGLADHGGIALCEELVGADLDRFPEEARQALAVLTRRLSDMDHSLRDVAQEATNRLTSAADVADRPTVVPPAATPPVALTEWLRELPTVGPGERTVDRGEVRMRLAVAVDEYGGEITLAVAPPVGDVPVRVRSEADEGAVTYLGWLTDGIMDLEVDSPPPYEVRLATRWGQAPDAPIDAYVSEPPPLELAVASDREEKPRGKRRLVVPHLDLEVTTYESDGQIFVSVSSGAREADGRWLEVVLNDLRDGSARECVVPLRWAHDAAEGALTVGTWHDRLAVAVGSALVDDTAGLRPETVRWSAEHAADERTRAALLALLADLAASGGPAETDGE